MAAFEPNTVNGAVNVTVTDADTGAVVSASTGTPVVDPTNPSVFYLGTEGGVYKSVDGGTTWHRASAGLSVGAVNEE